MARQIFSGKDHYLVYGAESAFGTPATPSGTNTFGKVQNFTVDFNNNLILSQGIGEGANVTSTTIGNFEISGSINTKPVDFTFLQYAVGPRTGSGTTASPYILTESDQIAYSGAIPTITLEIAADGPTSDQAYTIDGVAFNGWQVDGRQGEELSVALTWAGRDLTRGTSITSYTTPTQRPYIFHDGVLTWNSETLKMTQFSISCDHPSTYPREVNDRFVQQPVKGIRKYSITATILKNTDDTASTISSTELLDEFFGQSNSPISEGTLNARAMVITVREGTGSGDQVVTFQFSNCYITSWSENPSLEGGPVETTVNIVAESGTSNQPITWYTTT